MFQAECLLSFLLGIAINTLLILVFLSLNGKIDRHKKRLSLVSLAATLIFSAYPTRIDHTWGGFYFGFPADDFTFKSGWLLTCSFGWVFNFFFFYWIFKLIIKLWKASMKGKVYKQGH